MYSVFFVRVIGFVHLISSLSTVFAWPFSGFYKARECHAFAQQYEADSQDRYSCNGDAKWGAGRLFFFLVWSAEEDECPLKRRRFVP
jgi:hypothetical protein